MHIHKLIFPNLSETWLALTLTGHWVLFQSPFHYNECEREKFSNESPKKWLFKLEIFPLDISYYLKYRMQWRGTFIWIGFPSISINSNILGWSIILFFNEDEVLSGSDHMTRESTLINIHRAPVGAAVGVLQFAVNYFNHIRFEFKQSF